MSGTGLFIVLEGLDGAGTTTQAKMLVEWLESKGHKGHLTAEPSRGPIGRLIREVLGGVRSGADGAPLTSPALAALFVADRADHIVSEIEPALAAGTHVVCDRYVHSSLAYQGVDNDVEWIAAMNAPMRRPDLTIFVRVEPETASRRRAQRGSDEERFESDMFQKSVAEIYLRCRSLRPQDPLVEVDGHGDVSSVHRAICAEVDRALKEGVES